MSGRILCYLGWHRWRFRDKRTRTANYTYARCTRENCPRYSAEMIVNVDLKRRDLPPCSCRRYAFPSPLCERHST